MALFDFNSVAEKGFIDDPSGASVLMLNNRGVTLVQQWNLTYRQQVTPVYECGTSTVYFSMKHASGQLTINRIVYENPDKFLKGLGTVCKPAHCTLTAVSGKCGKGASVKMDIKGMVAESIGFSGQVQQAYVSEDISVMFASVDVTK